MKKTNMKAKSIKTQSMRTQSGFTLIEVMVVIVILGILAGVLVPQIFGQQDRANVKATNITLSKLANALEGYKLDNMKYPTTAQGLKALKENPGNAKNWDANGYYRGSMLDGWKNEVQYLSPGTGGKPYELYSFGADGKPGGEGLDADIELEQ